MLLLWKMVNSHTHHTRQLLTVYQYNGDTSTTKEGIASASAWPLEDGEGTRAIRIILTSYL